MSKESEEKFAKEGKEKDSEVEEMRMRFENMKEKARKYKNEAKLGVSGVGLGESKVAEMEKRVEQLVKELDEKEAILNDMDIKRKKSETEVSFLCFSKISNFGKLYFSNREIILDSVDKFMHQNLKSRF